MVHVACSPARVPGFIVLPRLDLNRVFGYATAIVVHAVLLLLLLVPITAPPTARVPTIDTSWHPIDREKEPPPPPPPVRAEVKPHQVRAVPTRTVQPAPPTEDETIVDRENVTTPIATPPASRTGDTTPPGPLAPIGIQLEYADAPAPAYPRDALRDGVQGTVLLKVLVDVDGRPLDVQVERSSGNRSLDRAAREQVLRRWRFRPATQDGHAVQAIGLVPVDFRLD